MLTAAAGSGYASGVPDEKEPMSPPTPFWKTALEVLICTLGMCAILFTVVFCCLCLVWVLA